MGTDGCARQLARGVLPGVLSAAVALGLWGSGLLDRIEAPTWSWRVRALGRLERPSDDIALILVDQESLDWGKREMGLSWPWPREAYGFLLDFCRRGGARVVALDVLYTEPSGYGVEDDANFGAAVARSGIVVAAAFAGRSGESDRWPESVARRGSSARVEGRFLRGDILASRATFPVAAVATNAAGRRVPPFRQRNVSVVGTRGRTRRHVVGLRRPRLVHACGPVGLGRDKRGTAAAGPCMKRDPAL
jgi:adenylate cyclase